jgi:hypothetical protein
MVLGYLQENLLTIIKIGEKNFDDEDANCLNHLVRNIMNFLKEFDNKSNENALL